MRSILLLLTLLPQIGWAGDWDGVDYGLLVTASATTYIDWRQTQYIAKHPTTLHETNPILGEHPSVSQVNAYFARTSLLSGALVWFLPSGYRKLYLGGVTLVEVSATTHNRAIGVKFSFF